MTRVDLCAADDAKTLERLAEVIAAVGGRGESDGGIGHGLNRFAVGADELTVYIDAWRADLVGPENLVRRVLQMLSET